MKVVLDTNIFVSGIFFRGVPGKILDAWAEKRFEIVVTPSILEEYSRTLHAFGGETMEPLRTHWMTLIAEQAHLVLDPTAYSKICRDPHDEKFLYCAASARADYLVTGDNDLKILGNAYDFSILTPRVFLNLLEK